MANEVIPPVEPPATPVVETKETISAPETKTVETQAAPPVVKTESETKTEPVVEKPVETKPVVPEKYDLKLSEGSLLDAKSLETAAAQAKALGLSNEQAQAFLNEKDSLVRGIVEQQKQALDARATRWAEDVKNDKEIGGEALNENVETAKRFVQRFASDAMKKELDDTGLGNHPELIRMLSRAGKMMKEDTTIFPGAKGGSGAVAMEDVFYGDKNKK